MKLCLRLSISICLIGSILLNFFLVQRTFSYYKTINLLRIDPNENLIIKKPKNYAKLNRNETSIFLFGDSRIANWNPELRFPNCAIFNQGLRGQTTAQLKLRLEDDVLSYKPNIVVIQAGINDLKTIGLFKDKKKKIIKNCKANIFYLIKRITEEGADVVLLTIFPTSKPGFLRSWFWPNDTDAAIQKINAELKKMQLEKVHVIDADTILRDKKYLQSEFKKDMLHINRRGYEKLNVLLQPYLQKLITNKGS